MRTRSIAPLHTTPEPGHDLAVGPAGNCVLASTSLIPEDVMLRGASLLLSLALAASAGAQSLRYQTGSFFFSYSPAEWRMVAGTRHDLPWLLPAKDSTAKPAAARVAFHAVTYWTIRSVSQLVARQVAVLGAMKEDDSRRAELISEREFVTAGAGSGVRVEWRLPGGRADIEYFFAGGGDHIVMLEGRAPTADFPHFGSVADALASSLVTE